MSSGDYLQSCALLKFGGIYCWGNNDNGQLGSGDTAKRLVPTSVVQLAHGILKNTFHSASQPPQEGQTSSFAHTTRAPAPYIN